MISDRYIGVTRRSRPSVKRGAFSPDVTAALDGCRCGQVVSDAAIWPVPRVSITTPIIIAVRNITSRLVTPSATRGPHSDRQYLDGMALPVADRQSSRRRVPTKTCYPPETGRFLYDFRVTSELWHYLDWYIYDRVDGRKIQVKSRMIYLADKWVGAPPSPPIADSLACLCCTEIIRQAFWWLWKRLWMIAC